MRQLLSKLWESHMLEYYVILKYDAFNWYLKYLKEMSGMLSEKAKCQIVPKVWCKVGQNSCTYT